MRAARPLAAFQINSSYPPEFRVGTRIPVSHRQLYLAWKPHGFQATNLAPRAVCTFSEREYLLDRKGHKGRKGGLGIDYSNDAILEVNGVEVEQKFRERFC